MKVIVSDKYGKNFSNFVVVDTVEKVQHLKGVTTLIINSTKESDFNIGVYISELHKNGINQFVYINSDPSMTVRMIIKGVNGFFFEDEFYLEDEEELLSLLEEIGMQEKSEEPDEETALSTTSLQVVNDFIESFARGEERIKAPLYLEQVNQAVNQLSNLTHQQQLQINQMGMSAMGIFQKASTLVRNINDMNKKLEEQMKALQESENRGNGANNRPMLSSSISYFPTVRYTGGKKILVIKEYSPCRYLVSFLLAYKHHLHYVLNKRVKFVIVTGKITGFSTKYSDFTTSISDSSLSMQSLFDSEDLLFQSPKKEVFKELFSRECDIIIVLDKMYSNLCILDGRVTRLNAISGESDIARFKLNPSETIFSTVKYEKGLFTIPTIKGYPKEKDGRLSAYNQICPEHFKILDNKLELLK